jgi:hypothetical protein
MNVLGGIIKASSSVLRASYERHWLAAFFHVLAVDEEFLAIRGHVVPPCGTGNRAARRSLKPEFATGLRGSFLLQLRGPVRDDI